MVGTKCNARRCRDAQDVDRDRAIVGGPVPQLPIRVVSPALHLPHRSVLINSTRVEFTQCTSGRTFRTECEETEQQTSTRHRSSPVHTHLSADLVSKFLLSTLDRRIGAVPCAPNARVRDKDKRERRSPGVSRRCKRTLSREPCGGMCWCARRSLGCCTLILGCLRPSPISTKTFVLSYS